MEKRSSTRPSCALLAFCALLALISAPSGLSGVTAQATDNAACENKCAADFAVCKARNSKGFADCYILNKCFSKVNCDEECKHACAMCKNFWGHYVDNACDVGKVTCLSVCARGGSP